MQQQLDIAEEFESGAHINPLTPVTLNLIKQPHSKSQKKKHCQNSSRCKKQINSDEKQCTFKPKINSYKSRNLEQFLECQRGFIEKKQEKLQRMKQKLNEQEALELTCKPAIDNRSKKIANKTGESVFSRLSREREYQFSVEGIESFQPHILNKSKSISRQDNVTDLLYSDARRRIEKDKITARESAKKRDIIPRVNHNTDKIVLKVIRHEFEEFTKSCQGISPIMALSILSQIFNIDLNPKKDAQTEKTCEKILKYLTPSGYAKDSSNISLVRLWYFIESVLGRGVQAQYTRQEQNQIYKSFGHFYRLRLTKSIKHVQGQVHSFQPQILKSSQRLALKKRERMITEANIMITQHNVKISVDDPKELALADLYILERMHKQQMYQQQKLQRQSKQLQQCTFKPQITRRQRPTSRQSLTKPIQLNKTFKLKTQTENTLGTMNTQYSCDKQRSSFKHSISKQHKIHEIKDLEKTVQRLSAGRKNRQFSKLLKERGYPKDVNNWQGFRSSEKKAIQKAHKELKGYNEPRRKGLVFDVHVGNGMIETIELGRGQSITKAIDVVADKYGFDENKKGKLLQMMNYHLDLHQNADKENHI